MKMKIKPQFELIYKTKGAVYNMVPLAPSTLKAYEIKKRDYEYLKNQVKTFNRVKRHSASKYVSRDLNSIIVVDFPLYPLPGFVTNKGIGVVNLAVLPQRTITDYSPIDIYAMYLYVSALKRFMKRKPFDEDNITSISRMYYSIFMKMFGKVSGIIGAYSDLQPKLQFLILLYVYVGLMGFKQDENLYNKIAGMMHTNYDDLNLNYNFESTKDFLKAINENNIIPISENVFSTKIINMYGPASLPIFEDTSRFFAGIMASTVPGNGVFSGFLSKVNTTLYDKLVYITLKNMG